MRYALHDRRTSEEIKFDTIKELWAYVRSHELCAEGPDAHDIESACRLLSSDFEIHDVDIDGVVRVEGRAPPRNIR